MPTLEYMTTYWKVRYLLFNNLFPIVLIFILSFMGIINSWAETGEIKIDELTFKCPGCEHLSDSLCVIDNQRMQPIAVVCSPEGRRLLLEQTVGADYDRKHPSARELTRFLLNLPQNNKDNEAFNALRLLFNSEGGEEQLRINAKTFLKLQTETLKNLLLKNYGSENIWHIFWDNCVVDNEEKNLEFKALLAAKIPGFELHDLIIDFTGYEITKEINFLEKFSEVVKEIKPTWREELLRAINYLRSCSDSQDYVSLVQNCSTSALAQRDPTFFRYLERVKLYRIIDAYRKELINWQQFLEFLGESHYQQVGTPELNKTVSNLLKNLFAEEKKVEFQTLLTPGNRKVIEYFIRNDSEIADNWNNLIKGEERRQSKRGFLFLLFFVFIIIFSFMIIVFKQKRKNPRTPKYFILGKEFDELKNLLIFFNLDYGANLEDLNKRYRTKVKRSHPDTGEKEEDFIELQRNYERAKELIKKFKDGKATDS